MPIASDDPTFGTTGTGHLTFDVQSFAEEVTVTYDYDANDRLLTETLDAPGAADDRHTVYDWDGGLDERKRYPARLHLWGQECSEVARRE